ncbi:hypothetical protein [Pseudomonas sp. P9_31]|uniref:hypothetical protein n=1 Tax=Pseudomonas sp. P9_31 TaxID=3043448 RepID=UPI002A358BBC|nr:hypothetical protein [Pseudomonas sp. P9_31]WPN57896.1 hypothetical protein QMK51_27935 [Pseudomonas sp. P9_31]
MKKPALMKYKQNNLTLEGDELTLAQIKPALNNLIQNLIALPDTSDQNSILEVFKNSILSINDSELEIETVERESLLDAIYSIGEIVGLDPQTEFAEEWRGDW